MPASRRLACWLRGLADRVDGEPRPRKPKWSHPCPVCNARGYVAPHRGQHVVSAPYSAKLPKPPPASEKGGYSPRPEAYDLASLPNAPMGPAGASPHTLGIRCPNCGRVCSGGQQ